MAYETVEDIERRLRDEGVDENVIQQEAGYLFGKNPEDRQTALESSIGSYLQRSRSGGDSDEGGYDTRYDDPAVGNAPARADSLWGFPGSTSTSGQMFGSLFPQGRSTGADLARLNTLFNQVNTDLLAAGQPVTNVPGINLSEDIDRSLLSIMRGTDQSSIDTDAAIRELLASVGEGRNEERLTKRQLQATETAQLAQQGLMEQLRSQLADAGVSSLPGAPQGAEASGARRVTERVAVPFAQSIRENAVQESELADQRELNALQLATGWSSDKATRVLQASAAGTDRQRILSEIALQTLQTNMAWNSFLATFGLERERFMHEVRTGNLAQVGNVLSQFQAFLNQIRGGFIGQ